jgi:hypothetical protein
MDDGTGNVKAISNSQGAVGVSLVEGQNILRARMVERVDDTADVLTYVGQRELDNTTFMLPPPMATTSVPGPSLDRPAKYACEINADADDCKRRVNFERDLTRIEQLDASVTVKDWFTSPNSGDLWITHVGQSVTVYSPLLFPQNQRTLFIKGVSHKQSNEEGTTTDILLTNLLGGDVLQQTGAEEDPAAALVPPALPSGTAL